MRGMEAPIVLTRIYPINWKEYSKVTDVLQTGQQIWVRQVDDAWWLAQVPEVN